MPVHEPAFSSYPGNQSNRFSQEDDQLTSSQTTPALRIGAEYLCESLSQKGFDCHNDEVFNDESTINEYVLKYCGASNETTTPFNASDAGNGYFTCIDELRYDRLAWENLRFFYVYLAFAVPLVLLGLICNSIAILAVSSIRRKFSRHFILLGMSSSDTLVSLFTLLRRIDVTLWQESLHPFSIAVWQFCWLLSAMSLLGLALDMFICLTQPYYYRQHFVTKAVQIFLMIAASISVTVSIMLAIFDVQESETSQYIACGLIVLTISVMCSSHIYACISAETMRVRHQRAAAHQITRSKSAEAIRQRTFLCKCIITTSLLIASSLISWFPFLIYWLIPEETKEANVYLFIRLLTICLVCFHTNAVSTPIIYCLRFRDVRSRVKSIFRTYLFCISKETRLQLFNDSLRTRSVASSTVRRVRRVVHRKSDSMLEVKSTSNRNYSRRRISKKTNGLLTLNVQSSPNIGSKELENAAETQSMVSIETNSGVGLEIIERLYNF